MCRIPLIALVSLALAVPAFAQSKPVDLGAVTVKIMLKAFQVGDYATVETLFAKLPLESKEQFLHQATEILMIDGTALSSEMNSTTTLLDTFFGYVSVMMLEIVQSLDMEKQEEVKEIVRWIHADLMAYKEDKTTQIQLLGRLTASLLEESAVAADSSAEEKHYSVIIQTEFNEWWAKREEKISYTGNDTVRDALGSLTRKNGSFMTVGTRGWIERPVGGGNLVRLPVDFDAMGNHGDMATNYQLLPNDRLVVIPALTIEHPEPVSLPTAVKDIWQLFWR